MKMWSRSKPQKKAQEDEPVPERYKAPPPGYRYYSPRADSSPHYRKLLDSETTDSSSRSFKRRRILSIVLIAILAIDLVVMFCGGYLSSWQLLILPSDILWAVADLIALIGLLASVYEKIFSRSVRRAISRNAPLVSALIALLGVLIAQIV